MAVYMIAEVTVTDESWIPEYATHVHDIVHKHGGKYFSRSGNITNLEGEPLDSSLIALLEFPSMEKLQAFMDDPDYVPYRDSRRSGSTTKMNVIDATDLAGTIPYLKKG